MARRRVLQPSGWSDLSVLPGNHAQIEGGGQRPSRCRPPSVAMELVRSTTRPLSLLIRVLPTMSEGFGQPLQLGTYAMVQSIEQRNLSGMCYMLDLAPTRSSR